MQQRRANDVGELQQRGPGKDRRWPRLVTVPIGGMFLSTFPFQTVPYCRVDRVVSGVLPQLQGVQGGPHHLIHSLWLRLQLMESSSHTQGLNNQGQRMLLLSSSRRTVQMMNSDVEACVEGTYEGQMKLTLSLQYQGNR